MKGWAILMAKEKNKLVSSKVKFNFPKMDGITEVNLAGTFNNWNENINPLKQNKNGSWSLVLGLNPGKYEYKYKTNLGWFTDPKAEGYINNSFGDQNSLIEVKDSSRAYPYYV